MSSLEQLEPFPSDAMLPQHRKLGPHIKPGGPPVQWKAHRHCITSLSLSPDDTTCYSVDKGSMGFMISSHSPDGMSPPGGLLMAWDVETGKKTKFRCPLAPNQAKHGKLRPLAPFSSVAVSADGAFVAAGGTADCHIHLWDARQGVYVGHLRGHRKPVLGLSFCQKEAHELFSTSADHLVCAWDVPQRACVDTLHGHEAAVLSADTYSMEHCLTAGQDRKLRLWKLPTDSQVVFNGVDDTIDTCYMVDEVLFIVDAFRSLSHQFLQPNWISALSGVRCSDLVVSGSCDGFVRLWSIEGYGSPISGATKSSATGGTISNAKKRRKQEVDTEDVNEDETEQDPQLAQLGFTRKADQEASAMPIQQQPVIGNKQRRGLPKDVHFDLVGSIPVDGFINSLQCSKSARFVVIAASREHRLGRWLCNGSVRNRVLIQPLDLSKSFDDTLMSHVTETPVDAVHALRK
eukprot:gene3486-660_t